jgi:hypothetical protein
MVESEVLARSFGWRLISCFKMLKGGRGVRSAQWWSLRPLVRSFGWRLADSKQEGGGFVVHRKHHGKAYSIETNAFDDHFRE